MTYVFEDRITALEKKSTQGATLSPVKLWSGDIEITNTKTIAVTGLSKYRVVLCKVTLYGQIPVICIQNDSTKACDDIGGGHGVYITITISNDNVKIDTINSSYTYPRLLEVWGIG